MGFYEDMASHGFVANTLRDGQTKMLCPKCSRTRNKNKNEHCLSMAIDVGGAQWRCHHCDWEGNEWRNSMISPFKQVVNKKSPKIPALDELSYGVKTWFEKRGIGEEVLCLAVEKSRELLRLCIETGMGRPST